MNKISVLFFLGILLQGCAIADKSLRKGMEITGFSAKHYASSELELKKDSCVFYTNHNIPQSSEDVVIIGKVFFAKLSKNHNYEGFSVHYAEKLNHISILTRSLKLSPDKENKYVMKRDAKTKSWQLLHISHGKENTIEDLSADLTIAMMKVVAHFQAAPTDVKDFFERCNSPKLL